MDACAHTYKQTHTHTRTLSHTDMRRFKCAHTHIHTHTHATACCPSAPSFAHKKRVCGVCMCCVVQGTGIRRFHPTARGIPRTYVHPLHCAPHHTRPHHVTHVGSHLMLNARGALLHTATDYRREATSKKEQSAKSSGGAKRSAEVCLVVMYRGSRGVATCPCDVVRRDGVEMEEPAVQCNESKCCSTRVCFRSLAASPAGLAAAVVTENMHVALCARQQSAPETQTKAARTEDATSAKHAHQQQSEPQVGVPDRFRVFWLRTNTHPRTHRALRHIDERFVCLNWA